MKYLYCSLAILTLLAVNVSAFAEETIGRVLDLGEGATLTIDAFNRTKEDTILFKGTLRSSPDKDFELKKLGSWSLTGVSFIHLASRKVYWCINAGGASCFGSTWEEKNRLAAGTSKQVWAHFTAPPAEIKEVSFKYGDSLPIDGIIIGEVVK